MRIRLTILAIVLALLLCSCAQSDTGTEGPTFTKEDLTFELEGIKYPLDSDAAPLLEALGPDYEETRAPSCVYEGEEDKIFDYGDIIVYTYPQGDKDMIWEIDIYSGDYSTNKGIKIGSTLEEVKEAYGESGFGMDYMYAYNLSGDKDDLESPQLNFELMDGKVSGISYYTPSNIT